MASPLKKLHSDYSRWGPEEVEVFFKSQDVDPTSLRLPEPSDGTMQYFCTVIIVFLRSVGEHVTTLNAYTVNLTP